MCGGADKTAVRTTLVSGSGGLVRLKPEGDGVWGLCCLCPEPTDRHRRRGIYGTCLFRAPAIRGAAGQRLQKLPGRLSLAQDV